MKNTNVLINAHEVNYEIQVESRHKKNYLNIFRRNNVIHMELTLCNKALSGMTNFAIQLNKNSFGLTPAQPLNVPVLNANQTLGNVVCFEKDRHETSYYFEMYVFFMDSFIIFMIFI